jgi:hypothetical protein
MKTLVPVGGCLLAIGLFLPAANASTITFTGTGSQDSIRYDFQISGDDFSYRIGTTEGPYVVATCPNPGAPCEFQRTYAAGVLPLPDRFSTFASLGDVSTNLLSGLIIFAGSLTPPMAQGEFETTVPVAFSGQVIGHYGIPPGSSGAPVAFRVLLAGTGSADLAGIVTENSDVVVNKADYKFSGTALTESEIPEPGAMFLAAGGIGLLAFLLRRRTLWG